MSKLEDLVPPLELCRKIPPGEFADSVLVWDPIEWEGEVYERRVYECRIYDPVAVPAPTLQEILFEIDAAGGYCPSCRYQANTWQVDYEDDPIADESLLPVLIDEEDRDNPAAAALKLWLELVGAK